MCSVQKRSPSQLRVPVPAHEAQAQTMHKRRLAGKDPDQTAPIRSEPAIDIFQHRIRTTRSRAGQCDRRQLRRFHQPDHSNPARNGRHLIHQACGQGRRLAQKYQLVLGRRRGRREPHWRTVRVLGRSVSIPTPCVEPLQQPGQHYKFPKLVPTGFVHCYHGILLRCAMGDISDQQVLGNHDRVVTFITKAGGLPGYSTIIILVPEYELGITILTAGSEPALLDLLREAVTVPLIRAADEVARRQTESIYAGTYEYTDTDRNGNNSDHLNSSLTLTYSTAHGLEITHFISNGTDVLAAIPAYFHLDTNNNIYHLQTVPTTFTRSPLDDGNEDENNGERWRILLLSEPRRDHDHDHKTTTAGHGVPVWDDFCITNIDMMAYAGKPFNELVFRNKITTGTDGSSSFKFGTVELTGFRVSLDRVEKESEPGPALTDDDVNTAAYVTGSWETSQEQFTHDL
ncbi:uncharacterized protein HMPREF1120_04068 [Exophiala dermatitidis NIH/UT8656]|uniref:Beta-lactamase-like ARB-00930-like C-terminal domain-containing protein n=1 Tax=Exophiala dermatitidis (strain ATCC 34100 / CBS 525.76 / NIH/UT8656) TaxID=858893 RepID=H6BVY8_EXODN|nr:uncharacterized protein HMPREF1120_04068 [Exophiala dermatitidis NIH/UT8656]EHY55959.1 hypothetical protein HMPREF1120_04068 [Exophiala dermatitidis NIH/UT8656]